MICNLYIIIWLQNKTLHNFTYHTHHIWVATLHCEISCEQEREFSSWNVSHSHHICMAGSQSCCWGCRSSGGQLPQPSVAWPPGLVLRRPFVVGRPPVCAQWWWFHCHLHAVSINIMSLNIYFSPCFFFFVQNIYCTLTPPSLLIKFSTKASYFSLQFTPIFEVYVCLNILEYCLYCQFFYMSNIPVPCLNLASLKKNLQIHTKLIAQGNKNDGVEHYLITTGMYLYIRKRYQRNDLKLPV